MAISTVGRQEKAKLDLYDKKIFYSMSLDARKPLNKLAKELKISVQRLYYKIDKQIKDGTIEPAIVLNYPLLKINSYILFTQNLSNQTIKRLKDQAPLFAFMNTVGKYQHALYIITNDILQFCKKFLPNEHVEICPILKSLPDDWDPFKLRKTVHSLKQDKQIKLDKKDYIILKQLSKTPLKSILNLSEKTRINRQTIKARIKEMQDANIIQKFRTAANCYQMGFLTYLLKIEVIPKNKEKILSTTREDHYSGFTWETTTGFIMNYLPPSHRELFKFTKKLEAVDKKIKINVSQITDYSKIEPVPKEILKIFDERSK